MCLYHLESRWLNSHVLVYHIPFLRHLLGVVPSTFQMVYLRGHVVQISELGDVFAGSVCKSNHDTGLLKVFAPEWKCFDDLFACGRRSATQQGSTHSRYIRNRLTLSFTRLCIAYTLDILKNSDYMSPSHLN